MRVVTRTLPAKDPWPKQTVYEVWDGELHLETHMNPEPAKKTVADWKGRSDR